MASMQHRFTHLLLVLVLFALLALIGMVAADVRGGPLDPTNPPGSTQKPLSEVEPRIAVNNLPGDATAVHIIDEPGAYYLTDDVLGVTGKHGIVIASRNVTLDLNGFTVDAFLAASTLSGIIAIGEDLWDIDVINGTVDYWGGAGIDLSVVDNSRISSVNVSDGFDDGILVGRGSVITDCILRGNSSDGIVAVSGAVTITGCHLESNGEDGIEVLRASVVRDNTAFANGVGIRVAETNNRIEGNHITNSFTHLVVEMGDNVIVKNTLGYSFAQNYSIVPGNAVGPFLSTGTPPGTAEPWANFEDLTPP